MELRTAAAIAAAVIALPVAAAEYTRFEALWVDPLPDAATVEADPAAAGASAC